MWLATTRRRDISAHIVVSRKLSSEWYHLKASSGVQPTCRLIHKQDFGRSDELTCDAKASLLSAADSFANRSSHQGVGLFLDSKWVQKLSGTAYTLNLWYVTVEIRPSDQDHEATLIESKYYVPR